MERGLRYADHGSPRDLLRRGQGGIDDHIQASTYPSYPSSSPLRTLSITPTAARIAVVGCRNSYPLALHLHEQLMQLRGNIDILPHPGRSLAEELGECLAGNGTDVPARIGAINDGFDMLDELGD